MKPTFGRDPSPVAPSSLNSPPDPVAAPAWGDIAVGWLWVSALIIYKPLSEIYLYFFEEISDDKNLVFLDFIIEQLSV